MQREKIATTYFSSKLWLFSLPKIIYPAIFLHTPAIFPEEAFQKTKYKNTVSYARKKSCPGDFWYIVFSIFIFHNIIFRNQ